MKLSVNHKLIARNKRIAQYILYVSLALLVVGFIWSIRNTDPEKALIGWAILIPSYFLVQISIYMANRWGKSPRPDEIVIQTLKGLNDEYTLYNYTTPVPHLLVGPHGIWVLNFYHHKGEISFDSKKLKYRQKGGAGLIGKYLGQDGLPNIIREAGNLQKDIDTYLSSKSFPVEVSPKIINVFYSDFAEINGNNFPTPCLKGDKLKAYVRKESKNKVLSIDDLERIRQSLPDPD